MLIRWWSLLHGYPLDALCLPFMLVVAGCWLLTICPLDASRLPLQCASACQSLVLDCCPATRLHLVCPYLCLFCSLAFIAQACVVCVPAGRVSSLHAAGMCSIVSSQHTFPADVHWYVSLYPHIADDWECYCPCFCSECCIGPRRSSTC